jgi:predicted site-specific integrase-resolvase
MEMKISQYAKMHGVTQRTIWRWIKNGELQIRKTPTNRVRVVINENAEKNVAVYARVSSSENKDNLDRQKDRLVSYCNAKGYQVKKIVTEIGSGLNDTRPKLEALLLDKDINTIIVEHKDRLSRFGTNYIEKLLKMQGRDLEIVNPVEDEKSDLMEDFVSIVTSFTARLYGLRRSRRRTEKLIEEMKNAAD